VAAKHPEAAPSILGLTGPIACGKTSVGNLLLGLGALDRIDADQVIHELMKAGTDTTRLVERAFGAEIIAADGSVDRRELGARVFSDSAALRRLESLTHPAVGPAIRAKVERFAGREGVVVLDAVKLLQSDLADLCSAIWVVQCRRGEELRRLTEDRAMTQPEAEQRIAAQPDFDDPRVSAVIHNSGSLDEMRAEVRRRWEEFVTRDAR
jgi:dephospho-CoA kinase